jgi:hypothetical protein
MRMAVPGTLIPVTPIPEPPVPETSRHVSARRRTAAWPPVKADRAADAHPALFIFADRPPVAADALTVPQPTRKAHAPRSERPCCQAHDGRRRTDLAYASLHDRHIPRA